MERRVFELEKQTVVSQHEQSEHVVVFVFVKHFVEVDHVFAFQKLTLS